jgi:hypothetical protein
MVRKTVARRHSKALPMSSDLDDLIRREDDLYELPDARAARPRPKPPNPNAPPPDPITIASDPIVPTSKPTGPKPPNPNAPLVPPKVDNWRTETVQAFAACKDAASLFEEQARMNLAKGLIAADDWQAAVSAYKQAFDRINMEN